MRLEKMLVVAAIALVSLYSMSSMSSTSFVVDLHAADNTLVDAVKSGNKTAVRTLLKKPTAVNTPLADGTTALHWAVQADDLETTDLLIRAGADVKVVSRYGVTPLALAAENGNAAIVERLLKAGADPQTASPEGQTALMTAARAGSTAVVKLLLSHGANPDARERWLGQTALMWSAAENHPEVVEALIEIGADPNVSSKIYFDYDLKPREGGTPKANESKGGMSALHYAARQGAKEAVEVLARKGVDLNQADPDGVTALIYATINGHYDTAALLLEKGADPNRADALGRTVLYLTIDNNRLETAAPRPAPKTEDELSPVELAKLAIAKGANLNSQIVGKLPPRSAQGNGDTTPEGATPLWRAAKTSDVEFAGLLLASGADPGFASRDGISPLMVAAGQGWKDGTSLGTEEESIAVIQLLLGAGMDINLKNNRGETALHGAAGRGADKVVRFLVDNGATLDARDKSNRTPLDVALGIPSTAPKAANDYSVPEIKKSTSALLRELMTAKGLKIEPYVVPEPPKTKS
jgi:ankyrin repeat protein